MSVRRLLLAAAAVGVLALDRHPVLAQAAAG